MSKNFESKSVIIIALLPHWHTHMHKHTQMYIYMYTYVGNAYLQDPIVTKVYKRSWDLSLRGGWLNVHARSRI